MVHQHEHTGARSIFRHPVLKWASLANTRVLIAGNTRPKDLTAEMFGGRFSQ